MKEILSEPHGYNDTKCQPPWDLSDDNANGLFKKVDNGFAYCRENAPGAKTAQADFANDPVSDTRSEIASIAAGWDDYRSRRDGESDDDASLRLWAVRSRKAKAKRHAGRRKRAAQWETV